MKNTKVKYSFAQWCKDNNHEDWLSLWDYELNDVGPDEVGHCSGKKFYFKCPRGIHESETKVPCNLVSGRTHLFCNQCCSFGQYLIDTYGNDALDMYWSEKNTVSPMSISKGSQTKVFMKCNNHSNHPDYLVDPEHFVRRGSRCPVCCNKQIIPGVNDIATTHPEYIKYFKHPEDAKKYSIRSGKYVWFKCPECGSEKYTDICNAFSGGCYSCLSCKDGVSYVNKFIYCCLRQIQEKYDFIVEAEKVFEWSKKLKPDNSKRVYDFYVNNGMAMIIEAHGAQHYERGFDQTCGGRTVKEEQDNDLFKYNLAIQNGISQDRYVVLDCRVSDKEFIKHSIMGSQLPELLKFNEDDVDWDLCDIFSTSNFIKRACQLWLSGVDALTDIAAELGVANSTVSSYLRKGDKLGLIIYESKFNKPVLCLDNNYVFPSSSVCSKYSNELFGTFISSKNIRSNANNENETTHGYKFTYISREQFRHIKEIGSYCVFE